MIWIVISVSKEYSHGTNHQQVDTRYWYVYYLNEYGKITSKRVNLLQALYYKTKVKSQYEFLCEECGNFVKGNINSLKTQIACPHCGE